MSELLVASMKRLDQSVANLSDKESAMLCHWRHLEPQSIQMAYETISQGCSLVEHTSTKFSLMSKVSTEETTKIAKDLVKGCESLVMATLVFYDDESGCSWSLRKHTKRHVRSVLLSCIQLMESIGHNRVSEGALKTGAVWNATQTLAKLPRGNRSCVRRDLFSYMADCNDTIQEFQEIVDNSTSKLADNSGDEWRYSPSHLPIARSCIALVKCSRGTLNVVLKACDSVGFEVENSISDGRSQEFEFIRRAVDKAREVGEGMTDMASLLYPPLEIKPVYVGGDHLFAQVDQQYKRLKSLLESVESNETCMKSDEVSDMVVKLQDAVERRYNEAKQSYTDALT